MSVNLFLALFNMIPAFPMDGGRVLRALLATRMDYVRSTQIAAGIGQGAAVLFGLLGLFANPFLIFIALFIWIGARQEAVAVAMRATISGIPVSRVVTREFSELSPHHRISDAVGNMLSGSQQSFAITVNGSVVGILTRSKIIEALARNGLDTPLSEVMERRFDTVDSSELLERVLLRLQSSPNQVLAVTQNGRLLGLITPESLAQFLAIQTALRQSGGYPGRQPEQWPSNSNPTEGLAAN
jgi:predicted transcriptional regulator